MAWMFFPDNLYWEYDIGATAGILDNIPYALAIFLLVPYKRTLFKFAAFFWLINEVVDGVLRGVMTYAAYTGGGAAAEAFVDPLMIVGWAYIVIPLFWLLWAQKKFMAQPSAYYDGLKTYIFFKKPEGWKDLLILLAGKPTLYISVVHMGDHYFFSRMASEYQKQSYMSLGPGRLVEIKIPPSFGRRLASKLGTPYKLFSNNCATVLRDTGIGVNLSDALPGALMMRHL